MAVQKVNFLFFAKMGNGGKGRKVQFPKAKQSSIMKFAKYFKLSSASPQLIKTAPENFDQITKRFLFTFGILYQQKKVSEKYAKNRGKPLSEMCGGLCLFLFCKNDHIPIEMKSSACNNPKNTTYRKKVFEPKKNI